MIQCPHCGETHDPSNHFCARTGEPIELGPRLLGELILQHYRVVSILGKGPMGVVLEVEDGRTGIRMAAKIIHPIYARDDTANATFLEEARKAGGLSHPNLAVVYDASLDAGHAPTVVRELMIGECLANIMKRLGPLPIELAAQWERQSLNGLAVAHRAGLINLDVSPADIFIAVGPGGSQVLKIVDFGEFHLKHAREAQEKIDSPYISYLAPEQRKSGASPDARADLYAAGVMLYHMLSGQAPAKLPRPIAQLRPEVDRPLALIVTKAIEMNPDKRYQTAEEFEEALAGLGLPIPRPIELQVGQAAVAPPVEVYAAPQPIQAPEPMPEDEIPTEAKQISLLEQDTWGQAEASSDALSDQPPAEEPAASPEEPMEPAAEEVPPPLYAPAEPQQPVKEALPSVIVDMPEADAYASMLPKRRIWPYALGAVVLAGVLLIFLALQMRSTETKPVPQTKAAEEKIRVEITVSPESAKVWLDNELQAQRPIVLEIPKSFNARTIKASAENYEALEKIVVFDKSQTVSMALTEIVQPPAEQIEKVGPEEAKTAPAVETKPVEKAKREAPRKQPSVSSKPPKEEQAAAKEGGKSQGKKGGKQKRGGFSADNPY